MTTPRRILPDQVWMIDRTCTQRQFLLRPDRETNEIIAYCMAESAKRYDIGLIAWKVMSNHYHAVVHDRRGNLPKFLEHFHKFVAKILNVRWSRSENLWSTTPTCTTLLPTPEDVFRKVLYVLSNPVADHLVEHVSDWPGCSSFDYLDGKRTIHKRPTFFRKNSTMPETVELEAVPSPLRHPGESHEMWASRMRQAIRSTEDHARQARRLSGTKVLGPTAIRQTSPFSVPKQPRPKNSLRPNLAAENRERRLLEIQRLRGFWIAHEEARRRYIDGEVTVAFPLGTYKMRLLGARCEPAPMAA